ncbi:E3 ubiquitin-protein ligase TRIM8-like [Hypanus sabinus]|uniref:E3 ubiquitin-protein ligase TRIM8-like n=1 Tax=Hypanus sabinus TaxID=79690 RepID=UPI0028C3968A|nr:E3 ubiquitin-protein ligase TRIM8-like [Hypanus sabinus]
MASTSAVGNLKEELNCSICWNIYTEPVSLSCGHNFCRTCIENNWDKKITGPGYSCPECRAEYAQKPVLQKNLKLSNIIERFEATQVNEEPSKILCDFCLDSPFPAVMTCTNCEASLCEHHLRKHSERAAQKNHLLIEPASSLEDRKCSDHEKLIEYYCLDDQCCICVTCYVAGSHKNHDIRILKDVCNEKKSSLSEKLEQLHSFRITLEQTTKDLQRTEVNLKKDSATLRKQISDLFQEIRMLVTKQEKQILDTIITEKNTNLSKVLKKIQELQIKREVVIQLIQGVQDLKNQKDPLFFIKDFKSTHERILSNNIEVETIKVIWKMLEETTIMTIKQETKRIFEMISKLILDHRTQPDGEVTEEMKDQSGEDNLSDYLKPTASEDVRRLQHTSSFCKDMPAPLLLEKPVKSNIKVTSRGDQEVLWSPELQLSTSEQAAATHVVEETFLRPSARLRFQDLLFLAPNAMSQEVMEETYQFDDYYEEDYLTEHMISEDSESNASIPENLMYYTEIEEEGGETPYVMEGSQHDEYMNVLYMRKRRDKVTTKSI